MPLLITDKDLCLVHPALEEFVQNPKDQVPYPGAIEAIKEVASYGFKLAIASNQGGVLAGHKSKEQAIAEMRYCMALFDDVFDYGILCPDNGETALVLLKGSGVMAVGLDRSTTRKTQAHLGVHSIGSDYYRKPNPGMLNLAMTFSGVNQEETTFVGDMESDRQAAINAGVDFILAEEWRSNAVQL